MKLDVNFNNLLAAVKLMKPEKSGSFELDLNESPIKKLSMELSKGKSVDLSDVDIVSGLLSYKGFNVSLYIKANGTGAKFHIADCRTLEGMRANGRYDRYVVTTDTSGEFLVNSGYYETKARLNVCKNCLRQLNYKGCNSQGNIDAIVRDFDMKEFFSTYSSYFPCLPTRQAETAETGYSHDWSKISSHYRVEKNFACEQCGVNLRSHRHLLHVHHINGVKSDNKTSNLKSLCIDCHSKQPSHNHMAVSHEERQLISSLRHKQGLLAGLGDWQTIFEHTDPGVHGVLHSCVKVPTKKPKISHTIFDDYDEPITTVELAWPEHKVCVAISGNAIEAAKAVHWQALTAHQFLNDYGSPLYKLC